ncbi:MAG: DUF3857 domain-containing protein [Kiritimatiellae bacterium]|nr:DUF3857 domain-containing protein [Kiritimatiellia bacterium]
MNAKTASSAAAAALLFLCATGGLAREITPENYPDADTVVVDDRIETVYQADGTYVTTDEEWVKALTERGRRELSTVSIDYSLRYGKGEIVLVEIIDAAGVARTVDFRGTLKEATDNSATSMNIYDPLDKVLTCAVPGLRTGETRHVVTRRETTKSRVKDHWADIELFESTDPIVRASVRIDGPITRPLRQIAMRHPLGNVESSVVTNGERIVYSWTAKDSPQMFPEPAMPPVWTQGQHLRVSTAESWQQMSRWYWDLSLPHLEKTNVAMTNKVEELKGAAARRGSPQDVRRGIVRDIFRFVSQEVRYMGLTLEDTSPGYAPHDVCVTFDNRYGVCRDKAALLVALLRIAGFDAYPVLISASRAKMDGEVPSPFFNHAIAAVREGDDYILMDPTDESSRDLLPSYLSDCSYLVATPEGDALRTSRVVAPEKNAVAIAGKGRLSRDGSLLADYSLVFRGLNDNAYRRHLLSLKPEDRRKFFEKVVTGVASGAELLRCEIGPAELQDTSRELTVQLLVKFPEALLRGETRDELSVPTLSAALGTANWILEGRTALESRKYPLKLSSTASTDERLELDLAGVVGKTLSLPADETFEGGYSFSRTFSRADDTLVFARRLSVGAVEFSPDEYLELRERIKRVEAAERAKPSFAKDPLANANERILSQTLTYDLADDFSWVSTNAVVKEILTYKGKKSAAELKFAYNPTWQSVELVSASVSNKNGQVALAGAKEINLLDADWASAAPRYPASKELVVNLPSVEVGSVVSYTTVTVASNAPMPFCRSFYFDSFTPTENLSVRVDGWRREERRPRLLPDESMRPAGIMWRDAETVSRGDFAAAAARYRAITPRPLDPEKVLPGVLPADGRDAAARIKAIRDWMARCVRCVGPKFREIRLQDHLVDPQVVLKERYASRVGYVRTLCALLKGAGFDADIVLAGNTAECDLAAVERSLSQRDVSLFKYALCRVRVKEGGFLWWGGKTTTYYLGVENEYTPLGASAFDGDLFLDPQTGLLGTVAVPDAALAEKDVSHFDFSVRENGAVDLDYRLERFGWSAGTSRKQYAEMLPEPRSRHFQQLLGSIAQAASATRELETDTEGYPFALSFAAYVPDMAVVSGDAITLEIPQLATRLFDLTGTVRESPLGVDGEDTEDVKRFTVRFPKGYTAVEHLPAPIRVCNPHDPDEAWLVSRVASRVEEDAAVVEIELVCRRRRAAMLSPDHAALLREWNRLTGSQANTTIVVRSPGLRPAAGR